MPSVTDMMKSRPGSFLRHLCVSFLSGLLLRFVNSSETRFWFSFTSTTAAFICQIACDIQFSVSFRSNLFQIRSQSRFWYPVFLCFISQIPSQLMFILSLVSDSGSQRLNTKTAYIYCTHTAVCYTHCLLRTRYLCICIPAGLSPVVTQLPDSIDSLAMYGQAFPDAASWWSVLWIENWRATLVSRHTTVCTDAHLSILDVEFRRVLRVYT